MTSVNSELALSLNSKLLAKREEAEKMIIKEHSNIKSKMSKKNEALDEVTKRLEQMQEESSSLTYKSAILSADVTKLNTKIGKLERQVQETMCKIDEIIPKQKLAQMVLEKEDLILKGYYKDMDEREKQLIEFWENSAYLSDNEELQTKKKKLLERQEALEDEINRMKDKFSSSAINKLTEECMILKKRNAAFLRRKTRILEQLEKTLTDRKEELSRAKRNVTFRCS